ncbi:phosphatidylglycerophosphatase A family protein [Leuconostoc palmae]|uniref:phosphatidylglycerophosphatase A family protein n=1 Tax=Leuconostoc palmae TaxID=501487 RepID=UPI001C7CE552|nr:phosphatidylglycerophosphatase A [Leuconostoc palmae]
MQYATYENTVEKLKRHHIDIRAIAQIAYDSEKAYLPELSIIQVEEAVISILHKRVVQHQIWVALELDRLAEAGLLESPLQDLVANDDSLFGVDETLATAIAMSYDTIGVTNYGYIDKLKIGLVGELDRKGKATAAVTTFADDIVGALAAAAASKVAHKYASGINDSKLI